VRSNQVDGLAETYALFGRIPEEAREQVGVEMARIGYEILRAQKRDVAKDTGALEAGLSLLLQLEELRVRIGLLLGGRDAYKFNGRTRKSRDGGPFYGRIVELGRRAQTVLVTRGLKRKVRGNGRTSKRRVIYEGKPYSMKVKALAARPFVHRDRPEIRPEQRLAAFWSEVLSKSGGAA
jgi:hypothetical protein